MKKETKKNMAIYDAEVTRKSLEEIISDILKNYTLGKKIKVTVSG